MDKKIVFDYMEKDKICSHVEVDLDTKKIKCIDYTDNILKNVFGKREHNITNLRKFFAERCFDENRPDKKELLNKLDLHTFNPFDIVKKTRGLMYNDYQWIRFQGDTATYDEIKIRDN